MSRKRTPTMTRRIPEEVTYYITPGVLSTFGVMGTPIIVTPRELSEEDLYILFRGKHHVSRPRTQYIKVVMPNAPITNATLAAVSWDSKFCIRYQLENRTYLTDMHGVSLFDVVEAAGIKKGGKIPGSLIWISTTSIKYMRLTHTEGSQFRQISHKDDVGVNKRVKKQDLELGALYETYSGKQGIYLGAVNTINFLRRYGYFERQLLVVWRVDRSMMLWYEVDNPLHDVGQDFCGRWDIERFKVKGDHSYRKSIKPVTIIDQEKLLPKVRKAALQHVANDPSNRFNRYSALMNVYPKGVTPVISQEVLDLIEDAGKIIIVPGMPKEELPRFLTHENQFVREEAKRYYDYITGGVPDAKPPWSKQRNR